MDMGLSRDDLSAFSLKILWLGRFHPALHPLWTTILTPINFGVCCLFISLAVKGVLVSYNNDMFFTAECLQTCILMLHASGKFLNLHVQRQVLFDLVAAKSKFWKIRNVDDKTFRDCQKISSNVNNIIHYYYYLNIFVCIFFDLQPFSTGYLPTGCYVPEGWFNYLTVILWYLSGVVLAGLPGTDCFFCSLATSLIIQFKLLGHKFKHFAEEENTLQNTIGLTNKFKQMIDYHNFLLRYCRKLNDTFRSVFLIQFMISIASASVSVFIFMQEGPWTNRIKFLLYFVATMIQTAFYCVPLEFVTNAAANLERAIYETKWYCLKSTNIKKQLTIILIRSQKNVIFSGHGLVWMNLRTFVLICKTVFTFYTYLNSVSKIK